MFTLLLYIFIGIVLLQLFYYLGIFSSFSFSKENENNPKRIPVSVIVYARNQAEEIKRLLPNLVNQNYHDYEIVLVDNDSSDETLDIFKEYSQLFSSVRVVHVQNNETFWNNKKYALTLGIKAAKNEYLLFVDAEQWIDNEFWIMSMSSNFTLNKTIIIGPFMYIKRKGLFNKLIRFDAVFTQLHSFSWTSFGSPFSFSSKNIGYKKEEFYNVNGFITHMNIRNNERELFINEAAKSKNTTYTTSKNSFIYLKPFEKFSQWISSKKTDDLLLSNLNFGSKVKVRLFNFSQFLFFVFAILLLSLQIEWIITTIIIIIRYIFAWIIIGKTTKKFHQKDLIWLFPFLDFYKTLQQTNIFISNLFRKKVI